MNISDLTITSLETITVFHPTTGEYWFTLDELQNATIAQSEEKSDVTGKQGRKLTSLKRNKGVKISATNGLVSHGLLEGQTGGAFSTGAQDVMWTDHVTVNSNAATTTYKAVGTTGNEIGSVYVRNSDGTLGTKLTQASAADTGKFTYDPETKALAFKSGELADNTEIVVFYTRKISGDMLDNNSDSYSGKGTMYIDAMAEDLCNNLYRVQIYVPKADFSGEFSIELGGDQATHAFEAESLAGKCGLGGSLWTYTVFGASAADVA